MKIMKKKIGLIALWVFVFSIMWLTITNAFNFSSPIPNIIPIHTQLTNKDSNYHFDNSWMSGEKVIPTSWVVSSWTHNLSWEVVDNSYLSIVKEKNLQRKTTKDGVEYFEDKNGKLYLFGFTVYHLPTFPLEYKNAMNLKLDGIINDFTNSNYLRKHLVSPVTQFAWEFQDKSWEKLVVVILPSKENNTFDDLFWNLVRHNPEITSALFLIEDNKDIAFRFRKSIEGHEPTQQEKVFTENVVNDLIYWKVGLKYFWETKDERLWLEKFYDYLVQLYDIQYSEHANRCRSTYKFHF